MLNASCASVNPLVFYVKKLLLYLKAASSWERRRPSWSQWATFNNFRSVQLTLTKLHELMTKALLGFYMGSLGSRSKVEVIFKSKCLFLKIFMPT